jgi:hypothetical protein
MAQWPPTKVLTPYTSRLCELIEATVTSRSRPVYLRYGT